MDGLIVATIIILIIIIIFSLYMIRNEALRQTTIVLPPRKQLFLKEDISLRPKKLEEYQKMMQRWIDNLKGTTEFGQLQEQCLYALKGGKFVRPIIALEIGRIMSARNNLQNDYTNLALTIEYIHTSSLIIDDMAYFDDDAERRGRPSLHVAYGQAIAEMAALTLLVASGQNLARQFQVSNAVANIITFVTFFVNKQVETTAYGQIQDSFGNISNGGEMNNLASFGNISNGGEMNQHDVIKNKTSTFFQIATVVSYLLAGGDINNTNDLMELGNCFAQVLQLTDDIADAETDINYNYVHEHGLDKTFEEIEKYINKAYELTEKHSLQSTIWREIFEKLLSQ